MDKGADHGAESHLALFRGKGHIMHLQVAAHDADPHAGAHEGLQGLVKNGQFCGHCTPSLL